MNQEEFLKAHLSSDLVSDEGVVKTLQKKIINKCIDDYKKSTYLNLDEMILISRKLIKAYKLISAGITAKQFRDLRTGKEVKIKKSSYSKELYTIIKDK